MRITKDNAYFEIRKQIRKIERAAQQHSQHVKRTFGVTGPQLGVLRIISEAEPLTLSELTAKIGVHITTAEGIVNRLHKGQLVHKRRNKRDRRSIETSTTEKGEKLLKNVPTGLMQRLYNNLRSISDSEARALHRSIARLVELVGASHVEID
jgi:DNA-binding MarR family transcriptional regulator